jgi:hypothetical protein
MSVNKYQIAREFRKGVAARILGQAIDISKCSKYFEEGYGWASEECFGVLYDALNKYLVSVGEEKIEIVEAMRNEK